MENKINLDIKNQSNWKNKDFLYLFIGNAIYNLTFAIFTISIPIMIYNFTSSTLAMSTMRVIEFLPNLLLALFIGVIIDRINRKKILQFSIVVQIICVILVLLLYSIFSFNLFYFYMIGIILFTANYTFGNAYHSTLPIIVRKKQLIDANSAISLVRTIIDTAGPSFAAMIFFIMGVEYSLLIPLIGLLCLLILVSITNIPHHKQNKKMSTSFKKEILEGWNQLVSLKLLWIMTLMILCINVVSGLTGAILIFFALDSLNLSEIQLGVTLSMSGVGAIVASLIAKKSLKYFNRGTLFLFAIKVSLLAHLILYLGNTIYSFGSALALIGLSGTFINIHYLTLRQQETPNHLLGRVAGTSSMIMKLAVPFSFFLGGLLGEIMDVKNIFLGSGLILFILIIYGFYKKIQKIK